MSSDVYDVTIVLSALVGMWAMYLLGRRHGVAAEHRRVHYLIDVARCTVTSWSVIVLDAAVEQRIGVEEMREGLRKKWNWEKFK